MTDVIAFTPRPRAPQPVPPPPLAGLALRVRLEEAAHTALDAADQIIAALDCIDGDADLEPDADAEPSLAAPENPEASQVEALRGGDEDREEEAPEIVLPEITVEADVSPAPPVPLPWRGAGNVVSAAGCAVLALIGAA